MKILENNTSDFYRKYNNNLSADKKIKLPDKDWGDFKVILFKDFYKFWTTSVNCTWDIINIDNDITNTPIICIIPLNRFENPETITSNQRINIKITAVRNKFNQSNIQVVGTPV